MTNKRYRENSVFSFFTFLNFVITSVVFTACIYLVNHIVMSALEISPAGKAGNDLLTLSEVHNTGAAFSLLSGQTDFIITASFFALAIIFIIAFFFSGRLQYSFISAMSALTAGISMNLYERINYNYVIDYIHLNFIPEFPVFNTSDIFIVFGAFGLILALLLKK